MCTLDLTILDELKQEFKPQILKHLLQLTIQSAESELLALKNAMDANSHSDIRRIVHKMVGIFGQYGALETSAIAKKISDTANDQLQPICQELLQSGLSAIIAIENYTKTIQ
jgi:HPt (histidine-containing phosphotransfer) domain-containing protein